jgi:hypothetical protein
MIDISDFIMSLDDEEKEKEEEEEEEEHDPLDYILLGCRIRYDTKRGEWAVVGREQTFWSDRERVCRSAVLAMTVVSELPNDFTALMVTAYQVRVCEGRYEWATPDDVKEKDDA